MTLSMTGFATQQLALPHGILSIELRAVNHRYLDIQLRMPDELKTFEPLIRQAFAGKILRGKVECRINIIQHAGSTASLQLDSAFLQQLVTLSNTAKQYAPHAGDLCMGELLRWPGVLISESFSSDAWHEPLLSLLQLTLHDFIASRQREGAKLAELLNACIEKIDILIAEIRPHLPVIIAQYDQKLKQRLSEALQTPDEERICQEIMLFAQRVDIEEELGRLVTHLHEIRRIIKSQKPGIGKQLDFLLQELNREANTLGAKSVSIKTSQTSIALKVLIEQMREQVQNIE